jgi:ribulose kinase
MIQYLFGAGQSVVGQILEHLGHQDQLSLRHLSIIRQHNPPTN